MAWQQLVQYIHEARDPQFRGDDIERMMCKQCATTLQTGPDGGLFCPFDGWRPEGQGAATLYE